MTAARPRPKTATDRIKNFQKFRLLNFYKRLPTYLPTSSHFLPPPPPYLLSITPSTPRVRGPVHFPAKRSLFSVSRGRGAIDFRSSGSSRQHSSGFACCQHFFFPFGHSSSTTNPPRSVRPWSQPGPAPTIYLPACLPGLPRDFVSCVSCRVISTNRTNGACSPRRPLVRVVCSSVVDCRLSALKFSVLPQGFCEPRAPRHQTEPRVAFGTPSSLPACVLQLARSTSELTTRPDPICSAVSRGDLPRHITHYEIPAHTRTAPNHHSTLPLASSPVSRPRLYSELLEFAQPYRVVFLA